MFIQTPVSFEMNWYDVYTAVYTQLAAMYTSLGLPSFQWIKPTTSSPPIANSSVPNWISVIKDSSSCVYHALIALLTAFWHTFMSHLLSTKLWGNSYLGISFVPIITTLFLICFIHMLFFSALKFRVWYFANDSVSWATLTKRTSMFFMTTIVFFLVQFLIKFGSHVSIRCVRDHFFAILYTISFLIFTTGFYILACIYKPQTSVNETRTEFKEPQFQPFCTGCFAFSFCSNFFSVLLLTYCSQVRLTQSKMLYGILSLCNNSIQYLLLLLCHQCRLLDAFSFKSYAAWVDASSNLNPLTLFGLFSLSYWIYFSNPEDAIQEFLVVGHFILLILFFLGALCLDFVYKPNLRGQSEQFVSVNEYIEQKVESCVNMKSRCLNLGREISNLTACEKEPDFGTYEAATHLIRPKRVTQVARKRCKKCGSKLRGRKPVKLTWKRDPKDKLVYLVKEKPKTIFKNLKLKMRINKCK